MNDELYALLALHGSAYYDVMPAKETAGITYTRTLVQPIMHESGLPLGEVWSYIVRVFQAAYSQAAIDALCAALRAAGWSVGPLEQIELDDAQTHYMTPIMISKWRT